MPRRSADIGASTSRPLIRRRERNRCSQLLFFLVFYVANEDPRRATRPQRVPSKPDHPHLKASSGRIGSGGWIRTSDQLINSQLRYHCATPEQSSAHSISKIGAPAQGGDFACRVDFKTGKVVASKTGMIFMLSRVLRGLPQLADRLALPAADVRRRPLLHYSPVDNFTSIW